MDWKVKILLARLDAAIAEYKDDCRRFVLTEKDFKIIKDFLKSLSKPHVNINQNLDNITYRGRTVCAMTENMKKEIPVDKF